MFILRSADEEVIVGEMIKHADAPLKEIVLQFLNQILMDDNDNESSYITLLQMMSKNGTY